MMTAISGILACHTIQMSPGRRLLGYVLRYRRDFSLGFLCVIATAAVTLTGPWVLKYAVDDLARGVDAGKLWFYGLALLALAAIGGVFRFVMRRIIIGASRGVEYDLRNEFFAHLQRLDLAYFEQHRTGDLMSRATSDLNAVRMMIGPAVMYSTTTGLTFIVAIAVMISIDPWLTLYSLIPLPFLSVSVAVCGNAIHRRFGLIQEQLSEISAMTQETLSGVRVVRAYGQEPFEIERFSAANEEYVRRNRGLIRIQSLFFPMMGLLMGLGALLGTLAWKPGSGGRPHHRGRARGLQRIPDDAHVADDRLRLGDEPPAARNGVVESHAGRVRCRPGRDGCRCHGSVH